MLFILLTFLQIAYQSCDFGYFWTEQTCLPCDGNIMESLGDECTQVTGECQKGYSYSSTPNFKCIQCPQGCTECQLAGNQGFTCSECSDNYMLISNTCISKKFFPHQQSNLWQSKPDIILEIPVQYEQFSSKLDCSLSSFLNEFGGCEKCPQYCYECFGRGTCKKCIDGYYWKPDAEIDLISGSGKCVKCAKENVLSCDYLGKTLQCKEGYYLNEESQECILCVKNCAKCENSLSCKICRIGQQVLFDFYGFSYLNRNNECIFCPGNTKDKITCKSCKNDQENQQCKECMKGYEMLGYTCGICSEYFEGCLECEVRTQGFHCSKCDEEYYQEVNSEGLGSCQKCSSIDSTYQNCYPSGNGVKVTKCKTLKKTEEIFSDKNYFLVFDKKNFKNVCIPNAGKCLHIVDLQGNCDQCLLQHNIVNGVCKQCPQNCKQCKKETLTCQICSSNFFLNDKDECQSCSLGCQECEDEKNCKKCVSGYVKDGKICQKCNVKNCVQCKSSQICQKCENRYFSYTENNKSYCLLCPPGCASCQKELGRVCDECLGGYFQKGDGCSESVNYCAVYNQNGSCNQCKYGAYSQGKQCLKAVSMEGNYVYNENAGPYSCFGLINLLVIFQMIIMLQ